MIVNVFVTKRGLGQSAPYNWKKIVFYRCLDVATVEQGLVEALPEIKQKFLPKLEQKYCVIWVCRSRTNLCHKFLLNKEGKVSKTKK